MHSCTPKYCGVLSSVITPSTFDREKTPLHPRAGCNVRCQKETAPLRREQKGSPLENPEEKDCGFLRYKYHILNPNEITNILNDFNVNVYTVIITVT
ncbi:hypothetical protein TNCV_3870781 [Trichonephila clavipes]|nr:hypothetical protein TNCV_3870781 [Trichonephila clavipes]